MPESIRAVPLALLLAALLLLPGVALAGGAGAPAPSDAVRAAAAALEAMNHRIEAKLEEARILEGMGEHEKALAAVREIENSPAAGPARADRSRAAAGTPPAAAPPPPRRPGAAPPAVAPPAPPPSPAPGAVAFLLRCQGPDGLFHAASARAEGAPAPGDGRDPALTAWAVLALADAREDVRARGDAAARTRIDAALVRAADALARAFQPGGALDGTGDVEGRVLAAWALGAAYGRGTVGDAATAGRFARAAVLGVIAAQDPSGAWRRPGGTVEDDLLLTTWACASLHEARPLAGMEPFEEATRRAVDAAKRWVGTLPADASRSPAARAGAALLAQRWLDAEGTLAVVSPADPAAVLLGSVLAVHTPGAGTWGRWRATTLRDFVARQERAGPAAGSWKPEADSARANGRLYGASLAILAWLADLPYVDPVRR